MKSLRPLTSRGSAKQRYRLNGFFFCCFYLKKPTLQSILYKQFKAAAADCQSAQEVVSTAYVCPCVFTGWSKDDKIYQILYEKPLIFLNDFLSISFLCLQLVQLACQL